MTATDPLMLIPAIDLKEGRCVRLRQGRMEDATVFSDDPVEMALKWQAEGAERLHLVDLDGAFAGRPVNRRVIGHLRGAGHPGADRWRDPQCLDSR